jgi:GH15 family glucan-1,4-alpha-glucosidase
MQNLNYGVIGNCRSAALVSQTGSIDWCCLPDFDSPSIFAKILDQDNGGEFSFHVDYNYVIKQKYFKNTNILCTEFKAGENCFEVIDFMPRYKTNDMAYYGPAEVYRYIRYISGSPVFKVVFKPKMNYGKESVGFVINDDYIKTYSEFNPTECIYLYSSLDFSDILEEKEITLTSDHFILLSYNQKLITIDIDRVYMEYQRTKVYWLNWVNRSKKYTEYNDIINRSLLVLNLMSYHQTGAVLAALTTSIPETIGEVRNWDYRFCWLRDASMSIDTLLKLGHYAAAKRFLGFIKSIIKAKHDSFQIMYGIRGERELKEEDLPHLSGYENSKPVRTGNAAYIQKQNDVFGYLMNVIYQYYMYFPGTLDEIEDIWEIVRIIMRTVVNNWDKPDKGIWEIRKDEKHFVFSKVMCWVAADRGAKIARLLKRDSYAQTWSEVAENIKTDVISKGWNTKIESFTQTYCSKYVDASLLLMEEYGFIDAKDEKYISTVLAIRNSLFYKGLMYRYINPDDFGQPTSSFTICTFWMVQALFKIGQKDEAARIFNDLLSYANHLGLFSEDIDFETKRLLGNFPQAYSHLALINTAIMFTQERQIAKFIKP